MSRIKSEFVVLRCVSVGEYEIVARDLDDSSDARKWIKYNGEDGSTYQIAALKGEPVDVEIETIKKRKLFEHAEK